MAARGLRGRGRPAARPGCGPRRAPRRRAAGRRAAGQRGRARRTASGRGTRSSSRPPGGRRCGSGPIGTGASRRPCGLGPPPRRGRVDVRASDGRGQTVSRFLRAPVPATQTAEAVSQHGARLRVDAERRRRPGPRAAAGRRVPAPGARPADVGGPDGRVAHRPPRGFARTLRVTATTARGRRGAVRVRARRLAFAVGLRRRSAAPAPGPVDPPGLDVPPLTLPAFAAAATRSSRPPATSPATPPTGASTPAWGPRATAASSGPTGSSPRWRPPPSWASATSSTRTGRWRRTVAPTTAHGGT